MNDMEIANIDAREFHLFLDIFVHWSGKKITAAAAYYGDDIDWAEHGVDLQNIVLTSGSVEVTGRYIPHGLDTWEPAVLFDFEDAGLEELLRESETVTFTINAGPHRKEFSFSTAPAQRHGIAMSQVVQDCNRWMPYYFDYYLGCLGCDHVYVYDNYTQDSAGLQAIVRPYAERGQATYIPWHHRWRNAVDEKQIGQIPQQVHSLNKFGNCDWMGFFDYDEFLRIPGKNLKQFLADFDPVEVDGLSFGLRWFMYKGEADLEQVGNPLLSFLEAKRDALGRKRQKLFVSPRNVRFVRIHWLEEGKTELPIDDTDIFFHHYYLLPDRFEEGKTETGTARDDYMLGFAEPLIAAARARSGDPRAGHSANKTLKTKPRTAEQWIAHVLDAFDTAEAETSKLSNEVRALPGMCGLRNRHFLNALCAFDGCRYLEIGSHKGASLCAAMDGNAISAVAIDDWSQFGGPREDFLAAAAAHKGACTLQIIEQDCFTVDPAKLGLFDVFFYDGDHSADSHARALRRYYDSLNDHAVVIVDDWNWQTVREGTFRAMAELDIPVIFEKEIVLPEADVVDMPRHRGRTSWWNGIFVMVIDKQAAPLSASARPRSISGQASRDPDTRQPIEVIVFSKDRACQLDGLLRSLQRFVAIPHRVTVLYTASDPAYQRGYDLLIDWNQSVRWVRERDFKTDLLRLVGDVQESGTKQVMFLVDDIVFTRRFTGEGIVDELDNDDVLAISLRLGESIRYCHPRSAPTRPPEFLEGHRWAWRSAPGGYWDYPMSVDGNIYRVDDIAKTLAGIDFSNPNTLEAAMAGKPIDRPHLVCDEQPYLVNLALNLVQNVFANPHGDISAEDLNRCFLSGFVIDIEQFEGREFEACHIEPKLSLVPGTRVVPKSVAAGRAMAGGDDNLDVLTEAETSLADYVVPVRGESVVAKSDGDNLFLRRHKRSPHVVQLNGSGAAIWSLCDGRSTVDRICHKLHRLFDAGEDVLRPDLERTLAYLESEQLLEFNDSPDGSIDKITLDLRQIPIYVINCKSDADKRDRIQRQLSRLGLEFEFIEGMECSPGLVGTAISHLRVLTRKDIKTPFLVLEDDCQFNENFRYEFTVPGNTDALYLGVSEFGIVEPGRLSWGQQNNIRWSRYDADHLRVFNMLARHAIIYVSEQFRKSVIAANQEALTYHEYVYPGDVGTASTHLSHLVLTPLRPVCHQAAEAGGNQYSTDRALTEM